MREKGFTLIELLAVIVILAIIALIATPIIMGIINEVNEQTTKRNVEQLKRGAETFTISEQTLDPSYVFNLAGYKYSGKQYQDLAITVNEDTEASVAVYENDKCYYILAGTTEVKVEELTKEECLAKVGSSVVVKANEPELLDNLTPIKYDGSKWLVADVTEKWYDYDNREWANAVVLKNSVGVGEEVVEENINIWLVWIPRYKYQLFNPSNGSVAEQEIQITFESGTATTGIVSCVDNILTSGTSSQTCTNASTGNWYTHPAFTFGEVL